MNEQLLIVHPRLKRLPFHPIGNYSGRIGTSNELATPQINEHFCSLQSISGIFGNWPKATWALAICHFGIKQDVRRMTPNNLYQFGQGFDCKTVI